MGKNRVKPTPPRRSRWRWVTFVALVLIAFGGAAFWSRSEPPDTSEGTPRLVVDRTEVDLGYLPFEAPARVVFTLTNTGDGLLRLAYVPSVRALRGC
ncbi:MAG: hypothetical protein ACE5JD_04650 [Candidatus Methylomirabilia bacterium]